MESALVMVTLFAETTSFMQALFHSKSKVFCCLNLIPYIMRLIDNLGVFLWDLDPGIFND